MQFLDNLIPHKYNLKGLVLLFISQYFPSNLTNPLSLISFISPFLQKEKPKKIFFFKTFQGLSGKIPNLVQGHHQQFPAWNLGIRGRTESADSKTGNYNLGSPHGCRTALAIPHRSWNRIQGQGDSTKKPGNCGLKGYGPCSQQNHLPASSVGLHSKPSARLKLTCPVLEVQLDQELSRKRTELTTERNLPMALGNSNKEHKKGFTGIMPVFPFVPKCHQKFTSDPITATNLLNNKISTE